MQDRFDAEEVARYENETWSRCAKGYMDGFGALVAEGIGPLLDVVKVSGGDRILDVGTGPGLVAARAAERGANLIGIDVSEDMLAEARRLHPEIEFRAESASLSVSDALTVASKKDWMLSMGQYATEFAA